MGQSRLYAAQGRGVDPKPPGSVRRRADGPYVVPALSRYGIVGAGDGRLEQQPEEDRLGANRGVHRVQGDPGSLGDRRHGGGDVPRSRKSSAAANRMANRVLSALRARVEDS